MRESPRSRRKPAASERNYTRNQYEVHEVQNQECRRSHPRRIPIVAICSVSAPGNTTYGSRWIVQVQPTDEGRTTRPRIPPTGVGGLFKCSLQPRRPTLSVLVISLPSRPRGERAKRESRGRQCRLDVNDPPTAVGGIQTSGRAPFVCRPHLNDPPTAVGGISHNLCRRVDSRTTFYGRPIIKITP